MGMMCETRGMLDLLKSKVLRAIYNALVKLCSWLDRIKGFIEPFLPKEPPKPPA